MFTLKAIRPMPLQSYYPRKQIKANERRVDLKLDAGRRLLRQVRKTHRGSFKADDCNDWLKSLIDQCTEMGVISPTFVIVNTPVYSKLESVILEYGITRKVENKNSTYNMIHKYMLIRQQITVFLEDATFAENRKEFDKFYKLIMNSEETTSLIATCNNETFKKNYSLALPMIKIICEIASAKQIDDLLLKFFKEKLKNELIQCKMVCDDEVDVKEEYIKDMHIISTVEL
ncbi:hypothetical protein A3Q56_07224 [Intoshia linei]|uniref:Uncharacterized protein n=1 Tax=Intoshia linei TaxID=1819745 RepID=A0A177AUK0_9BILA|nr:hypothetical protein A3Q56_07224 [Intoshia linei]